MKRIIPFLQSSLFEILGLAAFFLLYWWMTQFSAPPSGKELNLIEAAREAIQNHHFYYPTFNDTLSIPVSPLLTLCLSLVFKLFASTILTARTVVFLLSIVCLLAFHALASRIFHPGVGMLATGLFLATWGFFSNSYVANGAVLYVLIVFAILAVFFQWYDSAFRSRTLARSLYSHFIVIGGLLGLAFCTNGFPGVIFPLVVMATTIYISNRPELFKDIVYPWLFVPMLVIMVPWFILGSLSVGFFNFLPTVLNVKPHWIYTLEPFVYTLPILPLLIPAVTTKDIWNRAILSHQKSLFLLAAWAFWSFIFLILCSETHEAFSILMMAPLILWIGFYLSEVFRNPLVPMPLQLVMDGLILLGLILGVCCIILTFQLVPPDLSLGFVILSFAVPTISIILLLLRDYAISRTLPMLLIPAGLLLCLLVKLSFEPLIQFQPENALLQKLPAKALMAQNAAILEWSPVNNRPTLARLMMPLKNKVQLFNDQNRLEAFIQTRQGPVYLIIPETQFYQLPISLRELGIPLAVSWQWRTPMSPGKVIQAVGNEMLDFKTLHEAVFLVEFPVNPNM